ncbi:katanin p80 WD40 repeat-containing subunit B1 isoform X1 [Lutzomyia longipalpis]|uniref:katanin p80 WD40 repeat-containing subunit B1 isoform X1 n=1 Tax=Lutzomyia longipalpis TaxID=7200 RepID=UPI002483EA21|nr:katanin p80 WD40 repeat-containing subunit B1 isoform X1 [Lutzomyia longipalpis]
MNEFDASYISTRVPLKVQIAVPDITTLPDKESVRIWDVVYNFISLVVRIVSFGITIYVAIQYYTHGNENYMTYTLACWIIPWILTLFISCEVKARDESIKMQSTQKDCCLKISWIIFLNILRYLESSKYSAKYWLARRRNQNERALKYYKKLLQADCDETFLRLFDCFLETAPQKVLQIAIYFSDDIEAHTLKVTCLDVGQTGRVLVTGAQDRNVNLWAFGNDKCFMSLDSHNCAVDCVRFAYNDDVVYSADEIGIIKRWDLNIGGNCISFHGHMKSVRTLDFHPFGEYIVSGSNDTTIRLWDIRTGNCIKKYRGHIANVNSVRFSPDGSWIASAGSEGSVIIWDIRMSKEIIDFQEHASSVNCIQFHPFEFLLAAGRNDGTVDLYDLESKKIISHTNTRASSNPTIHSVKCVRFSENGECLFVGSTTGISVVGWEPDREFDHIESKWNILGDMKIINQQLICGSYDNTNVSIYAMNLGLIMPFYNPSNTTFNHNHSSRKSFNRGQRKMRLSVGKEDKPSFTVPTVPEEGMSSPNLSIEMEDDHDIFDKCYVPKYSELPVTSCLGFSTDTVSPSTNFQFPSYHLDSDNVNEYNLIKCGDEFSMADVDKLSNTAKEDFPVNSAQPPDYAPKMSYAPQTTIVSRTTMVAKGRFDRRGSGSTHTSIPSTKQNLQKKIMNSISVTNLNEIDEPLNNRHEIQSQKTIPRGGSPVRGPCQSYKLRRNDYQAQINKENNLKNRNTTEVQIFVKPIRSKSTLDMKCQPQINHNRPSQKIINYGHTEGANEGHEMKILINNHDTVYQELCNRHASLKIVKESVKGQDVHTALRQCVRLKDHAILVDLLGAILEKSASWTLDMCVILLPELYEMLQSDRKFYCTRACDTLRVILTNFLPLIKANADSWAARSLGVDINSEERWQKCNECRKWLLMIRTLPENNVVGVTLAPLQNLIIDI